MPQPHPLDHWQQYVDPLFLSKMPYNLPPSLQDFADQGFKGYHHLTAFGHPNPDSLLRQCVAYYNHHPAPGATFGHTKYRVERTLRAAQQAIPQMEAYGQPLPDAFAQAVYVAAALHRIGYGGQTAREHTPEEELLYPALGEHANPLWVSAYAADKFLYGRTMNAAQRFVVYYAILSTDAAQPPQDLVGLLMRTAVIAPTDHYDFATFAIEWIGDLFVNQNHQAPPQTFRDFLKTWDEHWRWVVPRQLDLLDNAIAPAFTDQLGWRHVTQIMQLAIHNLWRECAPHERQVLSTLLTTVQAPFD